jgi:phosphoribosylformimino-5-aminoimidazole carboxamide ribotide isomerase
VEIIPAIDLEGDRSRVVYWPGAATGVGAPTDRPETIAERFVGLGARVIHLVDFDGARRGSPANLESVARIASRVAVPLQLAGGLEAADHLRLAFAAGATRAVLGMNVVERPDVLRECVAVAGDWLAVGLDPRPDRLAAFPWRRPAPPTLDALVGELAGQGVRRFVLAHGGAAPDGAGLGELARTHDVDLLVAGGARSLEDLRRLRDAGIAGIILGEALLSGAIDYSAALEAAA